MKQLKKLCISIAIALVITSCMPDSGSIFGTSTVLAATNTSIAKPKILSVTSKAYNKLLVKWKKVSGASGYVIYRSTKKNSGYKKIKTVRSGSTTKYTDTGIQTGKTYYYKIKAYKKASSKLTYSNFSKIKSGKSVLTTPVLQTQAASNGIKLTSAKTKGISGYEIYRSTAKSGSYQKIKEVKSSQSLSYTDSTAKSQTVYYYKIRTYRTVNGKNVYSPYSTVKIQSAVADRTDETEPESQTNQESETQVNPETGSETESGKEPETETESETEIEIDPEENPALETLGAEGTDYYVARFSTAGATLTENASGITLNEDDRTVTITQSGTYVFTGTMSEYQIYCDTKSLDIHLILNGVTLNNSISSAIYSTKGTTDVTLTILDNTTNYVTGITTESDPDAAIYIDGSLTIDGKGTLNVNAPLMNGIKSKKILTIESGKFNVTASNNCISGKNSLVVNGGTINVTSTTGDGLKLTADPVDGVFADAVLGAFINGGNINIQAYDDGIQADAGLTINGGNINIQSTDKGLASGVLVSDTESIGLLQINGGTIQINSVDDSVHSNNDLEINGGTLTLSAGDDAIHADVTLTINDGDITILKSYEGIEGADMYLKGGIISVIASDDGINAAGGVDSTTTSNPNDKFRPGGGGAASTSKGSLSISGGDITVNAAGDGIDVNGDFLMTDGYVVVYGPTDNGNAALDYDGTFNISGGTIIAAGSSGMAQAPSSTSTQCSVKITLTSTASAGTTFTVKDSANNEIIKVTPPKAYQSIVVSTPAFQKNLTYSFYNGSNSLGSVTFSSTNMTLGSSGGGGKW